jgi:hypothetical protein
MGEYITMTLSDDEGEEDYYNKEISMANFWIPPTWSAEFLA